MAKTGDQIAGYALVRRLASGRRGEVWLAQRHVGGHQAAIKLAPWAKTRRPGSEAGVESAFRERLEQVRGLQHPSTAKVLAGGREAELSYVVTEFIRGVDLETILDHARRESKWPSLSLALHVVRHLSAALAESHGLGLVHGHLSPSQVLLESTGEVKLIGFITTPALHEDVDTLSHSGASREVAYLSPEHAADLEATDARSDVFSLGVLLCELTTRVAPFRRSTDLETLAAITEARAPALPSEVDEGLAAVIRRALARRTEDRFADAGAFLAAVDALEAPPVDEAELEALTRLARPSSTAAPWEVGEPLDDTVTSASGAEPSEVETPRRRFEILQRIGEGGMGEVYRARDRELDEIVALKVIARDVALNEQLLDRMRREVRLARKISSERVCRIHDLFELEDGARGISMQFVEGETLAALIKGGVPVDYARFASWGADVAEGLAAANALSVVHRDLKPENVMIDRHDAAVILDFGIAASTDPEATDRLTKQGVILGTLPYMAPEQLTAAPVDGRTDLYALGLILAELITGEVPFSASDYAGLLDRRVVNPKRYDLRSIDPAVPKDLAETVNRMLMANPSDRPAEATQVAHALRRVAHEAPTGQSQTSALEHPTPVPEHSTEPRGSASTAILATEESALASNLLTDEPPTEPPRSPVWSVLALGVAVVLLGVGLVVLGQVLERNFGGDEEVTTEPLELQADPVPAPDPDAGLSAEPEAPPSTPTEPGRGTRKKAKDWLPPVEAM